MTRRRLAALAVVALAVVALALWLSSRSGAPDQGRAGARVLPELEAMLDDVTSIRLAAKGDSATLERAGDAWVVEERDYPADTAKLRKLALGLARLAVIEEKTRNPASYAQLGVEDPGPAATGTLVDVVTPAKTYSLIVGKSAGSVGSFVRAPGSAQSLLAGPALPVAADPKQWIDTALADILADRVESLAVTPQAGPAWRAKRDAATASLTLYDLPRGKTQRSPDGVTPAAAMLVGLHIEDVHAAPTAAPDQGAPHVALATFDGLEIELWGRADGDHRYIRGAARSTGAATTKEAAALAQRFEGREFEVPKYKYDALFRPLSDFT
ncbi:MAG: DUF4340 domain-containing protein [Steroidobacteraceae bacterium]